MVRWSELIQRGVRSAIQIRTRFSGLLVRPLWIREAFSKRLMRRTSVSTLGFACSQKSIIGLAIPAPPEEPVCLDRGAGGNAPRVNCGSTADQLVSD